MENRVGSVVVSVILVLGVVLLAYLSKSTDRDLTIRFKGSFVLVDQDELHSVVDELSLKYPQSDEFSLQVSRMLSERSYVKNYSIRNAWPNQVIISVEEISPISILNGVTLLSEDCVQQPYQGSLSAERFLEFNVGDGVSPSMICQIANHAVRYIDKSELDEPIHVMHNGNLKLKVRNTLYIAKGVDIEKEMRKIRMISRAMKDSGAMIAAVDLRYQSGGAIKAY